MIMKDFKIDSNGKLIFERNDVGTSFDDGVILQDIKIVLKSIKDNYWMGANLEQYLGKPNTVKMKEKIKSEVTAEVLNLSYLKNNDIKVIINSNKNSILIVVAVKSPLTNKIYKINTVIQLNSAKII